MGTPNWSNRTLFHHDNLAVLRGMNSESVDLIATDPPFNKSKDFHATPDSLATGASFQDRWSWERDVHQDWVDQITDDYPRLMEAIESARYAHSDGMGAFMCFMAVRLLEMRRVLKPSGSIYLHCDPTASHYLKAVMDAIFGRKQFRNEIVWDYTFRLMDLPKFFNRKHDIILFYAKSRSSHFQMQKERWTRDDIIKTRKQKIHIDENGDEVIWMLGGRGNSKSRLKRLSQIINEGKAISDVWRVPIISSSAKERVGYPTQKPIDLYVRIIRAASKKEGIVLDPFAGCATTLIAAEQEGRHWVGIDIWDRAHNVVIERLKQEGLAADGDSAGKLAFGDIHYTTKPPTRTDDGEAAAPNLRTKIKMFEPPGQKMSRAAMYKHLLGQNGPKCQGCDRGFDDPRYLDLDHNTPRSDGGINHISNRILLCGPCNRLKSNTLTLSGLRRENKKRGYMADSEGEHSLMREIREERENAPPTLFD